MEAASDANVSSRILRYRAELSRFCSSNQESCSSLKSLKSSSKSALKISSNSKYVGSDFCNACMDFTEIKSWKSKCVGWDKADFSARTESVWASSPATSSDGMVRNARRR